MQFCKPKVKETTDTSNYETNDHVLELSALSTKHGVHLNVNEIRTSKGLAGSEAAARLLRDGKNVLSPPKVEPEWKKVLRHLSNQLLLLMDGAGILSFITYALDTTQPINLYLGFVLFGIVFLTAFTGYISERKSSSISSAFKNMLPAEAITVRDGQETVIPASDLVVGDLVKLRPGSRVPADLRLVLVSGLKIEMSSLTGEARPVEMQVDPADRESVIEAKNIAFSSALVIDGQALGVVIKAADNTYIGTIAGLASNDNNAPTTMYLEVKRFVHAIAFMAICMSVVLCTIGFARGERFQDVLINAFVSVVIANIPQGLPATVTSMLTIACASLSKQNVYVKRTEIIESLGSASVICSDKTGTLTMNLMTVDAVWCNGNLDFLQERAVQQQQNAAGSMRSLGVSVRNAKMEGSLRAIAIQGSSDAAPVRQPSTKALTNVDVTDVSIAVAPQTKAGGGSFRRLQLSYTSQQSSRDLPYADLMLIASVNNSAKYDAGDRHSIIGDASEAALLRFCDNAGVTDFYRGSYTIVHNVPFSSSTKFSAVVCEHPSFPGQHIILLKGAPEIVLEKCTSYMHRDQSLPLDERFRVEQKHAYEKMAGRGQRVLGFIRQIVPARDPEEYTPEDFPKTDYQFVGMTGLTDPPKPGVPDCILQLHDAGVRVFMVTGDHPFTAEAIGRQVNLINGPTVKDIAEDRGCDPSEIDALAEPEVRSIVLTGSDIRDLSNEEWDRILAKPEIVFARTTPQQKLEIVKHVQRNGHLVAVTGDGVNDAPALKQANIGVSMGKNASDVAREAADIILMDDNFANITHAIEAGRLIFDNLKKTIAYTVTHLWPEIGPAIMTLVFGFPLGAQPLLILSIDMLTELGPAIALGKEEAEADVMKRPPRNLKSDRLLSRGLFGYAYVMMGLAEVFASIAAFWLLFAHHGLSMSEIKFTSKSYFNFDPSGDFAASSGRVFSPAEQKEILMQVNGATFFSIVMCQFWHVWVARVRFESVFARNPFRSLALNMGVIVELAILVILVWVPGVQDFFQTRAPPAIALIPNLFFLVYAFVATELVKYRRRTVPGSCAFVSW